MRYGVLRKENYRTFTWLSCIIITFLWSPLACSGSLAVYYGLDIPVKSLALFDTVIYFCFLVSLERMSLFFFTIKKESTNP